jgi:hypothetical protein
MTGDGRQEVPAGQVREYNTYAGTYTFNGKGLITPVQSCSNPAYTGTEQVREVVYQGELMVLRPPVRGYVGGPPRAAHTLLGEGFPMSTDDDTCAGWNLGIGAWHLHCRRPHATAGTVRPVCVAFHSLRTGGWSRPSGAFWQPQPPHCRQPLPVAFGGSRRRKRTIFAGGSGHGASRCLSL